MTNTQRAQVSGMLGFLSSVAEVRNFNSTATFFYVEIHGEAIGIESCYRLYVLLNAQIMRRYVHLQHIKKTTLKKQTYGGLIKPFDPIFCGESPRCDMEVPPNVLVLGYSLGIDSLEVHGIWF